MAMTWADHMTGVNSLLDAERSRRAALRAATAQQRAASAGTMQPMPTAPTFDWSAPSGGANVGQSDIASVPGDFSQFGFDLGLNPQSIGGLLGALGGGLVGGPFGGLLGGLAGRGIGALMGQPSDGMAQGAELAGLMGQAEQNANNMAGTASEFGDARGLKEGGYTGAGRDGVVQPDRPANVIVHEGELVIPHHMVKKMMKGLMG